MISAEVPTVVGVCPAGCLGGAAGLPAHHVAADAEPAAVDVAQPDVCYLGGLTRTLRVAQMAAEAGLPVVPHSANLSLVTVFSLHLMAAIPNAGPYVEFSIEPGSYYPWQRGLFDPGLAVEDGMAAVPAGPGWGVQVRPEWLARAEHRISAL